MRDWSWIGVAVLAAGACTPQEESSATLALSAIGCADGQREGFTDASTHPNIAGCSGAWTISGIHTHAPGAAPACPGLSVANTAIPACERAAGDDGANRLGVGCNVADLCAPGWHVCSGADDVAGSSATGCGGATGASAPPLFFASRQSSTGCGQCATGTSTAPSCNSSSCAAGCLQTDGTSNEFFEWCVWVGFAVYGLAFLPHGLVALGGQAIILGSILGVTGIPPTEAQAIRSKGDAYRAYQRRVSRFVPLPPKRDA